MRFPRTWVIVAIALVVPHFAASAPLPRLVVDLSGQQDAASVLTHLQEAFGSEYVADVLDVEHSLDRGFGPWCVNAPAQLASCDTEPLSAAELSAAMAEVEGLMQALEYGEARSRLDALEARLCAATEPIAPGAQARIPFLVGIARFYASDHPGAREAFRLAVERQSELAWDANFPPDPQAVFLEAVAEVVRAPRVVLSVPPTDRPAHLVVDGVPLGPDPGSISLLGDRHLVQLSDDGEVWTTIELHAHGTERVQWVGPRQVGAGLSLAPDMEEGTLAFAALQAAAHERGHTEIVLLQKPLPELAWRHDAIERRWECVSLVLGKRLKQAKVARDVGGLMIGVGAAMTAAGVAIWATNYRQGADLQSPMNQSQTAHQALLDQYATCQQGADAGLVILAIGSGTAIAGIPVAVQGTRLERAAVEDPRLGVAASPAGAWVGLSGRF